MTRRNGFTLTEVLITLGILGILAALTIPRLFNNTNNAHVGAQFASAISAIETGAGMYLYDKGVKNTTYIEEGEEGEGTPSWLLNKLAGTYVKMSTANAPSGTMSNSVTCTTNTIYTLPDKSLICVSTNGNLLPKKEDADWKNNASKSELVFISSKSVRQKNLIEGYDFFRMSISAEGLIFLPGADYATNETCYKDEGGKACAGIIAKNGWKVDYKEKSSQPS